MELDELPEINSKQVRALKRAGIESVEALAAVEDPAAVAKKAGMGAERVAALREAALAATSGAAPAPPEPAAEPPQEEAPAAQPEATEPGPAHGEPEPAEPEAAPPAPAPAGEAPQGVPDKVVLEETRALARVFLHGVALDGVAIVTARKDEKGDEVLAKAPQENVVLLQEAATHAPVRVAGTVHGGLPIYKLKPQEGGEPVEVRVRVHSIRETEERKPGLLGRLKFGKKSG